MIEESDESLHPVGPGRWQESWYFNAYDRQNDLFVLARVGLRFSERRMDALVVGTLDALPAFAYPGINLPLPRDLSSLDPVSDGLRCGALTLRCREPLRHWSLHLDRPRLAMELSWEALHPPHDYRVAGGPPGIAQNHFEHTGRVSGWIRHGDRTVHVNGTGQRDKSWGVRDWSAIRGWRWISVQFGSELSFNLWDAPGDVQSGGRRYVGGYVCRGGQVEPVIDFNARVEQEVGDPRPVQLSIQYGQGQTLEVEGTTQGTVPLAKEGLWIEEAPATFRCRIDGVPREGVGVVELAYHVGRLGYLRRVRSIARTVAQIAPSLLPG